MGLKRSVQGCLSNLTRSESQGNMMWSESQGKRGLLWGDFGKIKQIAGVHTPVFMDWIKQTTLFF
jgi:hypothetical protein